MDIRRCQSVRIDVRLQNTGPLLKTYHSSGSIGDSAVALTDEPPSHLIKDLSRSLNTTHTSTHYTEPPSIEGEDTYTIEDEDKRASFEVCIVKIKCF